MAIALVQSTLCGNATTTGNNTSCTGNFLSNTTAGNFLVAACWTSISGATPTVTPTLTTSGLTWTFIGSGFGFHTPAIWKGVCFFGIAPNAPSISPGTITTFASTFSGSFGTKILEFALLEFSGCSQAASVGCVDTSNLNAGAASTPSSGTLVTTATDLILSSHAGETGLISAGPGFTLGPNPVAVQFGQVQYALNVAAGNIATAFSGTEANWGAFSAAILPGATPPPPVNPITNFSVQKLVLSVKESNIPVRGRNK